MSDLASEDGHYLGGMSYLNLSDTLSTECSDIESSMAIDNEISVWAERIVSSLRDDVKSLMGAVDCLKLQIKSKNNFMSIKLLTKFSSSADSDNSASDNSSSNNSASDNSASDNSAQDDGRDADTNTEGTPFSSYQAKLMSHIRHVNRFLYVLLTKDLHHNQFVIQEAYDTLNVVRPLMWGEPVGDGGRTARDIFKGLWY